MSAQTIDRYITSTICHEWGHILGYYLLYGTVKNITELQFIDTLARVDAHTVYQPYFVINDEEKGISVWEIQSTKTKDAMVRMAGALACKICGFSGFTRLDNDSTDAEEIRRLIPNKNKVATLRAQTEELLLPLREALIRLRLRHSIFIRKNEMRRMKSISLFLVRLYINGSIKWFLTK